LYHSLDQVITAPASSAQAAQDNVGLGADYRAAGRPARESSCSLDADTAEKTLLKKKKTTRTVEISIKTDEHLVIRHRRSVSRIWCAQCGKEVGTVSLSELGNLASVLQRANAEEKFHLIQTPAGLLVCLNSLPC
jgi:hypothetical protein